MNMKDEKVKQPKMKKEKTPKTPKAPKAPKTAKKSAVKPKKAKGSKGIKLNISLQIVLSMIAVVALISVVFIFYTFPKFESNITDVVKNQMMDKVMSEVESITYQVETLNSSLREIESNNTLITSLQKGSQSKYKDFLDTQKEELEIYKDLALLFPDGSVTTATNSDYYHVDYMSDPVVQQVWGTGGQMILSGVINAGSGEETIMNVVTLSKGDEFAGAIIGYLDYTLFDDIIKKCKVVGVDGLVTRLTDKDGIVFGSQVDSEIGKKSETKIITEIVNRLAAGEEVTGNGRMYTENGENLFTTYYVVPSTNWIITLTASQQQIVGQAKIIERAAMMILGVVILVSILVAILIALIIVKPIKVTRDALKTISDLDFRENAKVRKYTKKRDESGAMCQAIVSVADNLRGEMQQLSAMTDRMADNADGLQKISESVTNSAQKNTEDISAINDNIRDTAKTSEEIAESISQMYGFTEEMNSTADESADKTISMKESAENLKTTAEEANRNAKVVFDQVREKMEEAKEQAKSVDKIGTFTDSIMAISRQTKMLALNASIEAARAGEAGRGFAVVADQIGNLALQSNQSADSIANLVDEIYQAVGALEKCLEQSLDYMQSQVMPDYDKFAAISADYQVEAQNLVEAIEFLQNGIHEFSNTMTETVNSVVGISQMLGESADSVQNIKSENDQVVSLIQETYELIQANTELSAELENMVNKYTLV